MPKTYFVFTRYAGATKSGSIRGVFCSGACAKKFAAALAPTLDQHIVVCVTTSNRPRHPLTGQQITLYV